eukprot:364743-Chlamydomonas_euryale.AAC.11
MAGVQPWLLLPLRTGNPSAEKISHDKMTRCTGEPRAGSSDAIPAGAHEACSNMPDIRPEHDTCAPVCQANGGSSASALSARHAHPSCPALYVPVAMPQRLGLLRSATIARVASCAANVTRHECAAVLTLLNMWVYRSACTQASASPSRPIVPILTSPDRSQEIARRSETSFSIASSSHGFCQATFKHQHQPLAAISVLPCHTANAVHHDGHQWRAR